MYGKYFASTFKGSMFGAGTDVFAVWGYVIANAEIDGQVELNPQFIAACLGTKPDIVTSSIEFLCQPDPKSRNPAEEGRRLLHIGGMKYQIVSYELYRNIRDADSRREAERARQAKHRAKVKANKPDNATTGKVPDITPGHAGHAGHVTVTPRTPRVEGRGYRVEEEEKKMNIGGDSPTLAELVKGGLNPTEPATSSFTLEQAVEYIHIASVKTQAKEKIQAAFEAAIPEVMVFRKINDQAAQGWLMGRCCTYFETVRATWPREQWKYAKKPADFLASGTWREEPVIWDRSQQPPKEQANGRTTGSNLEELRRFVAEQRAAASGTDGLLDPVGDSPGPVTHRGPVSSLFPNRVEVPGNGHRSGVRQSGAIAQILSEPRGPDRADR